MLNLPPIFRWPVLLLILGFTPTGLVRGQDVGTLNLIKPLKVSADHHSLVDAEGKPFFYLADTAWELFQRLNREEADQYLEDRAGKGFTVIQAVALAELDGLRDPNPYGDRPLIDNDPTKPAIKDGPANDYWDHVDYIINRAEKLGLYIGFLPSWGDKWNQAWGAGPEIFTPENAKIYGEWLGRRYRNKPIIWILGGDRPIENEKQRAVIVAMAVGLRAGDGGTHLITFHPPGTHGSSEWFQNDSWLDFNMRQNGHSPEYAQYAKTFSDYQLTPAKPVIDGEPIYEDHPIAFRAEDFGYSVAADVRRAIYWDLFNGACGFTYGNHAVWQMYTAAHTPINAPLMPVAKALQEPGSFEMQYARWLFLSRPFLSRIPDPSILIAGTPSTAWPGAGRNRFLSARDKTGSYAMVYVPLGRKFSVRMDAVTGPRVHAWWYNPRNGEARSIGEYTNAGACEFTPPDLGEYLDWVLVLDDASKRFPPPGTH